MIRKRGGVGKRSVDIGSEEAMRRLLGGPGEAARRASWLSRRGEACVPETKPHVWEGPRAPLRSLQLGRKVCSLK